MIFLDDRVVLQLADPADLVGEMERAFAEVSAMPSRVHCDLPGNDGAKLLVMPAWLNRDAIGVKVATVMPSNRAISHPTINGLYVLLDGKTGEPQAAISAPALTAVRTAAVSGLAAKYLSRTNARILLMIGTGALAPHMIRAHAAIRQYERVLVWGRDRTKAELLIEQLADIPAVVEPVDELACALREADVISCATAATAPLVAGAGLRPGVHIDLVGSFTHDMREADSDTFARGRLVVDTLEALHESGDLVAPLKEGVFEAARVSTLGDLVRDSTLRRNADAEVTIFKAVGTSLADITAANYIHALHLAQSHGNPGGNITPYEGQIDRHSL